MEHYSVQAEPVELVLLRPWQPKLVWGCSAELRPRDSARHDLSHSQPHHRQPAAPYCDCNLPGLCPEFRAARDAVVQLSVIRDSIPDTRSRGSMLFPRPQVLHAAFIPFGEIKSIELPTDYESEGNHRGFAFVDFQSAEDAAAAMDNMHESELFGRTLRVNVARPAKVKEGYSRAVWHDENWLREHDTTAPEEAKLGDAAAITAAYRKKAGIDNGDPDPGTEAGAATATASAVSCALTRIQPPRYSDTPRKLEDSRRDSHPQLNLTLIS